MNEQRPVPPPAGSSQKPEQQLLSLVQASPSVVQPVPRVVHTCVAVGQLSSQQSLLAVQAPVACTQLPEDWQTPPTQSSEQQSAAWAQLAPGALHSLVSMQR
jgi:hypothetical protein